MAVLKTWDPIDLRQISFKQIYDNATDFLLRRPPPLEDVQYPLALEYFTPATVDSPARLFVLFGSNLSVDDATALPTGGTVQAIYTFFKGDVDDQLWYFNLSLRGISVPATDIAQAMRTESRADDNALMTRILSKYDRIILSDYNDYMEGRGGDDTINGGRGNDTLLGGAGNDDITGARGKDVLSGGTGRDLLISIADKSADVFVFNGTSGADTIQGFEDGFDRIQISGVDSMSQVMIRDAGADVMIRFGTTEITVTNIDHRLITGSDFLLV